MTPAPRLTLTPCPPLDPSPPSIGRPAILKIAPRRTPLGRLEHYPDVYLSGSQALVLRALLTAKSGHTGIELAQTLYPGLPILSRRHVAGARAVIASLREKLKLTAPPTGRQPVAIVTRQDPATKGRKKGYEFVELDMFSSKS